MLRMMTRACYDCPARNGQWCGPRLRPTETTCGCYLPLKRRAAATALRIAGRIPKKLDCPQGRWKTGE